MRTLFYHMAPRWSGSARAFAVAARGLAARGEPVTVVCRTGSEAEQSFQQEGLDVVGVPVDGTVGGAAWRLRAVLKDKFIEVVFLHTEREQLVAASAMRLAERGAVIRRVPAGGGATATRSTKLAGRMASSRMLFATDSDRARSGASDRGFLAPLGVDVSLVESTRDAARAALRVDDKAMLMMCVVDLSSRPRVTTALRTIALLAERHPELRLVLTGPGGNEEDTHMHAAALGVTSLVQFLGHRHDLPMLLSAADVGWVAADGDDGAFACLDFMAARVPVIAERSPLLSHFIPDGIAGVLLPPADSSDTAAAVASFLADDHQRTGMGNAGRTRAARDFPETAMIEGFAAAAAAAGDRSLWAAR